MMIRLRKQLPHATLFAAMAFFALLWLVPLLFVLTTSLKPESDTIKYPIEWIPSTITFDNFREILFSNAKAPLGRWLWNSLFVASSHTALVLLIASMAAYAYARLQFKGRDTLFGILMATMMVPPVMNFVPNYLTVDKLGWVDTYLALILPGLGGVFGVFLLRQFFKGIPRELEEAARIDGAGHFRVYWQIALPLARPALVTLAVFSFMGSWNDFLWPLIVTNDTNMRTLPPGLTMFQSQYFTYYGKLTAGAVVSAVPVLVLFLFAQRYFVKGISLTGLKG
jgi:multiple sugar transport system permease protein